MSSNVKIQDASPVLRPTVTIFSSCHHLVRIVVFTVIRRYRSIKRYKKRGVKSYDLTLCYVLQFLVHYDTWAILWMFVPVIELRYFVTYMTSDILLISMTILLIIAIFKSWFTVSKVKTISGILGICLLFPLFTAAVLYYNSKFAPYQMERIQQFLNGYRTTNYTMGFHSDYILQYVFYTYGIFAVTGICCILAILLLAILSIAIKQKNQLGFLMGCATDIVFLVNILLNILENMEIILITLSK